MGDSDKRNAVMTKALLAAMKATEPIGRRSMIILALLPNGDWAKIVAVLPEDQEQVGEIVSAIDRKFDELGATTEGKVVTEKILPAPKLGAADEGSN